MSPRPQIRRTPPHQLLARRKRARWPLVLVAAAAACGAGWWVWDSEILVPEPLLYKAPGGTFEIIVGDVDRSNLSFDAYEELFAERARAVRDLDLTSVERWRWETKDVGWLEELKNLETLRLNLADPEGLRILGEAERFVFATGAHSVRFDDVPHLPKLRYLFLETNAVQDLSHFADAPMLEHIEIVSAIGQDFTPFADCAKLRTLTVRNGEGELHQTATGQERAGDLHRYTVLQQLKTLELPDAIVIDDFADLPTMPGLRHLTVARPAMGDGEGLKRLTWLDTLTFIEPRSMQDSRSIEEWHAILPRTEIQVADEFQRGPAHGEGPVASNDESVAASR